MLFSLLGFLACIGDVRPGPNGLNSIILVTDDKELGSRKMLRQAKRYCKRQGTELIILEETVLFVCDMKEQDYIRRKNLAKAAQYIESTHIDTDFEVESEAAVEGIFKEVIGTAGAVTDIALGDCYEQEIIFECEN